MTHISEYRRDKNRCQNLKVEWGTVKAAKQQKRTWRCNLKAGHKGKHESRSGHRKWD